MAGDVAALQDQNTVTAMSSDGAAAAAVAAAGKSVNGGSSAAMVVTMSGAAPILKLGGNSAVSDGGEMSSLYSDPTNIARIVSTEVLNTLVSETVQFHVHLQNSR